MPTDSYDFGQEFQSLYISKQKGPPGAVVEKMKVSMQSSPPLGQVTSVRPGKAVLTAVLDVPQFRAKESWEVSVWYSADGAEWVGNQLLSIEGHQTPQTLQDLPETISRSYHRTDISFKQSVQFTLRFRHAKNEDWRWIRDEHGLSDGLIVASSNDVESDSLSDRIPDLNPEWTIRSCISQSPGTSVWSLEAPILPARGDDSTYKDIGVGTPWGSFLRWFALVRLWSPWLAPRHGKGELFLDKDAVLCSFMSPRGKNLVFLAISGANDVLSVFRHGPNGIISVHARNDSLVKEKAVVLVSEGDNFECSVAAVMYHARTLISRTQKPNSERSEELTALAGGIKPEWLDNWYDGLGFCTWNAIGQRLTEQKIFEAVDKLAEHKIKISSLIIDDNWQSIDYEGPSQFQYGWKQFEAEPESFPNGLKNTISHIRKKHPNIEHIAVWHALLGYWGGISPGGQIAKRYKTIEVVREDADRRNLPLGGRMTVVAKEDVARLYSDFYTFLDDCGIDAVKTDAQFMIDTWVGASARRELIKEYLDAWAMATLRYFNSKAISCMSQIPQALFYSQLPTDRPAILVRNSDDFFPEIPASHPWHVWANAYNAIFMKHLNVLPDWDMFQTVHDYSGFHAAARCVSGGPIYITDVPGEHNMDLIEQMTGTTPQGKTMIFRPSVIGKAVDPYSGYDDDSLLKVGSYHGASGTGTPILAIFNISARPLTELIPFSCFPGAKPSFDYVIRAHTTGKISQPTRLGEPNSFLTASLPVRGYEIFCAVPITRFQSQRHGEILTSNLGLVGKMTGTAAIVKNSIKQLDNARVVVMTRIKAFGILGIYISSLPDMTINGDFMATIQDQPIPAHTVKISSRDSHVLEVDIGKAWDEMRLESGWRRDIEVKVYFRT